MEEYNQYDKKNAELEALTIKLSHSYNDCKKYVLNCGKNYGQYAPKINNVQEQKDWSIKYSNIMQNLSPEKVSDQCKNKTIQEQIEIYQESALKLKDFVTNFETYFQKVVQYPEKVSTIRENLKKLLQRVEFTTTYEFLGDKNTKEQIKQNLVSCLTKIPDNCTEKFTIVELEETIATSDKLLKDTKNYLKQLTANFNSNQNQLQKQLIQKLELKKKGIDLEESFTLKSNAFATLPQKLTNLQEKYKNKQLPKLKLEITGKNRTIDEAFAEAYYHLDLSNQYGITFFDRCTKLNLNTKYEYRSNNMNEYKKKNFYYSPGALPYKVEYFVNKSVLETTITHEYGHTIEFHILANLYKKSIKTEDFKTYLESNAKKNKNGDPKKSCKNSFGSKYPI